AATTVRPRASLAIAGATLPKPIRADPRVRLVELVPVFAVGFPRVPVPTLRHHVVDVGLPRPQPKMAVPHAKGVVAGVLDEPPFQGFPTVDRRVDDPILALALPRAVRLRDPEEPRPLEGA